MQAHVLLQYIMGHSDISVTLNTYTHVKFEYAEEEMKKVAGWKKIQCHMKYHFYDRFMTLDGKDITK